MDLTEKTASAPPEVRADLLLAGFIRVDGLELADGHGITLPNHQGIIEARRVCELGCWDSNNSTFGLTLLNGEVYVRPYLPGMDDTEAAQGQREALFRKYAPNGRGTFVFFSNGEELKDPRHFLNRVANPDWSPKP